MSNFLEAPNGGGAGGNQQPPGARLVYANGATVGHQPASRRKGFARRGIADTRTLAEPIVSGSNSNIVVRSERIGSAKDTKLLQTGADCLINRCGHHSAAVRLF
jgi:hypothetical protein